MSRLVLVGAAAAVLCVGSTAGAQQNPTGLVRPGTCVVGDVMTLMGPHPSAPGGLIGKRFLLSQTNRLLKIDENELLGGFRKRPGSHPWIGEHVGKWLHAASVTYACTRNAGLRAKLDRVAHALIATQEPDGYLGTYAPDQRFGLYPNADWDVWSHKYNMLGLLSYYQITGDKDALVCCRRMADLLIRTFGPGKKSILSAGTQQGMASTSVLEPIVLLYRATGDRRYLDFAQYIVSSWDEPGGPAILSTLKMIGAVDRVANGKAYEMLSNLCGLCELYRATGDRRYLAAPLTAWKDIVANRLYITGSGSVGELWRADNVLPNGVGASICETCVTVTWEQLNIQLLRLTGEARFAEQIERTAYNHLFAAQKPTCDDWCYYTPLEGVKPYDKVTTCCHSSGPRGVALLPSTVFGVTYDAICVNLYTPVHEVVRMSNGAAVDLTQSTTYPANGQVTITVRPRPRAGAFALRLRIPAWSRSTALSVNGGKVPAVRAGAWATIRRTWRAGDRVVLSFDMWPRLAIGDHGNAGCAAILAGPLVFAADTSRNPIVKTWSRVALAATSAGELRTRASRTAGGDPVLTTAAWQYATGGNRVKRNIVLVPFYAASDTGGRFQVWLRAGAKAPSELSLLAFAKESRSRQGNQRGSIVDDDPGSFVVTFDGTRADEDWFAVDLAKPITVSRVGFAHGHSFHDGGWFDTSSGKPRVQVRRQAGGAWEDVAMLDEYPATTATSSANLHDGQVISARFAPMQVWGVRVVGHPACGDNSAQAFSSCGELQAFRDR